MSLLPTRAATRAAGSVVPLPSGAVTITSGLWRDRQLVNREVSIPHGMERLRHAGNFENFRHLLEPGEGHHGHKDASDSDVKNFVDSDVYKWLEAVGWESVRGPLSPEVEEQTEDAIRLIERAQDSDGYLNTWYQTQDPSERFSNLAFGHELYCLGHLVQAAIAFNRVRGDDRLLRVAVRFADLVWRTFGAEGRVAVCGHPEIEMALVELGRETGDSRFTALAKALIDRRGRGLLGPGRFGAAYYQDRVPVREATTVEGHAVRAVYLGCGAVDVAEETRDDGLLTAAARQWSAMVASKMYITGGIGSRHHGEAFGDPYELPNDLAYCETCASIGVAMWSWRLTLARMDGRHADVMERALLNGMLVGVSADGRSFTYVNPLQVRSQHLREEWFEIACCPPNLMRTIASVDQYVATEDDDGIQVHLYASADISGRHDRGLRLETDYPFDGRVRVHVTRSSGRWTIALRVPGWAASTTVSINGTAVETEVRDGYVRLLQEWTSGDVVEMDLGDEPRFIHATSMIDAADGKVAVERGPLVYCLESRSVEPANGYSIDVDAALHVEGPHVTLDVSNVEVEHTSSWPYAPGRPERPRLGARETARLKPYFMWGNDGPSKMAVWIAVADALPEEADTRI